MAEEAKNDQQPMPMQPAEKDERSLSNELVTEDYLKKILNKTTNKPVKLFVNKFCPKPNHSCFGNFPKEFIKKKPEQSDFEIEVFEKSQAATASSNCFKQISFLIKDWGQAERHHPNSLKRNQGKTHLLRPVRLRKG
jgi:hypothetical protein